MAEWVSTEPDQLVSRAADGDESGLSGLYELFAGPLYAFGLRRLGDGDLAQQLVQDVMTRLWRNASRYDPDRASVRTWVFGIARNVAVDLHRRRARDLADPVDPMSAVEPVGGDDVVEELEGLLRSGLVRAALDRLGAEHREVLELAYFRGLRQSEIATRLGLPLGTVKSRTYYALRALGLACDELGLER